ncbi:hypothetical protein [Seonamhaeicola sp.]|uniref:hypothetical protein n=1 Tax=Seonamhaeicola sp. TaxID=1912245 RepID=UPI00262FE189|nr:hypothetical protein [Seonamhaeicola sp.]
MKTNAVWRQKLACFSCLFFLFFNVSCDYQDASEKHGPYIDLGVGESEFYERLESSVVGQFPDGPGNPENLCAGGAMQLMDDDPPCGYVDVGEYVVNLINLYRARHNLPPHVRAIEYEPCAAREARLALENGAAHWNDGCGWRAQAAGGGYYGEEGSNSSVRDKVFWLPYNIYREGPEGGHYRGMMGEKSRGVAVGYYGTDEGHKIMINYHHELQAQN